MKASILIKLSILVFGFISTVNAAEYVGYDDYLNKHYGKDTVVMLYPKEFSVSFFDDGLQKRTFQFCSNKEELVELIQPINQPIHFFNSKSFASFSDEPVEQRRNKEKEFTAARKLKVKEQMKSLLENMRKHAADMKRNAENMQRDKECIVCLEENPLKGFWSCMHKACGCSAKLELCPTCRSGK